MSKENWLESFEAILVFAVPLIFVIPFYVSGFITEVSGNYVVYSIYVAFSILLTKYNRRSFSEIGLTQRGLLPSLGYAVILVAAPFLRSLIFTGLDFSSDVNSWASVANGLFHWMFSGFGQEVMFRGLILFSLHRWKGWKIGLVVSSVLFGLMHVRQGVAGVVGTILVGGYWGWVALKTGNIIGTSIAHGFYNFIFNFLFAS